MTLLMGDTTPRPWELKLDTGDLVYDVKGAGNTIMHNEAYYNLAPTIADAALIVRAVNNHEALVKALRNITESYVQLGDSGDAGFWDPREQPEISAALKLLASLE